MSLVEGKIAECRKHSKKLIPNPRHGKPGPKLFLCIPRLLWNNMVFISSSRNKMRLFSLYYTPCETQLLFLIKVLRVLTAFIPSAQTVPNYPTHGVNWHGTPSPRKRCALWNGLRNKVRLYGTFLCATKCCISWWSCNFVSPKLFPWVMVPNYPTLPYI